MKLCLKVNQQSHIPNTHFSIPQNINLPSLIKNQYRTPIFNEVIKLILSNDKGFGENKKGTKNNNNSSSLLVLGAGLEPNFIYFHRFL